MAVSLATIFKSGSVVISLKRCKFKVRPLIDQILQQMSTQSHNFTTHKSHWRTMVTENDALGVAE